LLHVSNFWTYLGSFNSLLFFCRLVSSDRWTLLKDLGWAVMPCRVVSDDQLSCGLEINDTDGIPELTQAQQELIWRAKQSLL
jgi:hypothetical protein